MGRSPMVPMAVLTYVSLLFSVSYSSTSSQIIAPLLFGPALLQALAPSHYPPRGSGLMWDSLLRIKIPSVQGWSGRIWARTGCNFDAKGVGKCMTGDCGGTLECSGNGAAPPTSLFEITLGRGSDDKDFYNVSLVDGYNLPIVALPTGGGPVGACNATGCVSDINISCPKELQVVGEEERGVVACKSACEAFGLDQYCCSGQFANPNTCQPSSYSTIFKRAFPRAYSYAFDDGTSTFTCKASEYAIIFCPGRVKRPNSQNSDPPSPPQNQYGQPVTPPNQNPYGRSTYVSPDSESIWATCVSPDSESIRGAYGSSDSKSVWSTYGSPTSESVWSTYASSDSKPAWTKSKSEWSTDGPPPQNQIGNGQFMPPPTLNQDPNDQFMDPPNQDQNQRAGMGKIAETKSSSDILRPYPVLLLVGFSLTALRQLGTTGIIIIVPF